MVTKSKRREPLPRKTKPASDEEEIRLRAYQLYEERGRIHGCDLDDWFQAEAEILGTRRQPKNVKRRKTK